MKKVYIVLLIIFILLFLNITTAYAVATELNFLGSESVEINSSNKIIVKLKSSKEVGIISGVLEKSSNVSQMKVEGKNNWNLTYNEETGEFNIYKAQGSKNDEIMEINYTVNDEGTAEFKLSNLNSADITYTEEELEGIEMKIEVTKKQSQEKNTTNTQNTTKNTSKDNTENSSTNTNTSKSNTTNTNSSNDTSNTSKNTMNSSNSSKQKNINDQKGSNNNEDGKVIPKVQNAKTEQKELPFTGIMGVLIPVLIVILGISGVAGYYGYKKYSGI